SIFTITSDQTNDILIPFYFDAASDALSGAGAVSVDTYYTAWTTTGADAGTLADGVVKGQLKKVQLVVDGGNGTLTIASPVSTSLDVVTFADAGDYIKLIWNGTAWRILESGNDADGATGPAVA
ncbi:MAG: hypothetical protein AB8B80_13880, partial [Marinicellaceae bacterium]